MTNYKYSNKLQVYTFLWFYEANQLKANHEFEKEMRYTHYMYTVKCNKKYNVCEGCKQ